jgi:hypothetical protein
VTDTLLAIDPGTTESAWVAVCTEPGVPIEHAKESNDKLLDTLRHSPEKRIYLEQIQSYGMPVGREVFQTVELCGRIKEIFWTKQVTVIDVPRRDVKLFWCNSPRAKDGNIRAAILERFGGKEKAIGRKAHPGPLYGIHADEWQALAIALMHVEDLGRWTA